MDATKERSTFVTVVAWILIVLSGFGTLIALLQNFMAPFILGDMEAMVQAPPDLIGPWAAWMFNNIRLVMLINLLVAATALVASIGLLRRANWARLMVIALMVLGILWTLAGLGLQVATIWTVQQQVRVGAEPPSLVPMLLAGILVSALLALALSVLLGWIAKRLASPGIAREFR